MWKEKLPAMASAPTFRTHPIRGGAPGDGLGAGLMGFDLVYEGGRGARVGAKGVEDGVNFAPEVAVGTLLKRAAFVGGMGLIPFNDMTSVDPQDAHEVARTELEEGEKAKSLGSRDGLAAWDFPLNGSDGRWVGGGRYQTGSYRPA